MPLSNEEKKKIDGKIDWAKANPGVDVFAIRDLTIDGKIYAIQRCDAEEGLEHLNTLSPAPGKYIVIIQETPQNP